MRLADNGTPIRTSARRYGRPWLGTVRQRWVIAPAVLLLLMATALSQSAPDAPQNSAPFGARGRAATHGLAVMAHPLAARAAIQGASSCQSCH